MEPSAKTYTHPVTGQKSDNPFDILDWLFGDKIPAKGASSTIALQQIQHALHPNVLTLTESCGLFEEWARERNLVATIPDGGGDAYSLSKP